MQNAYLDAKIGVDPAENEPRKERLCPGRDPAPEGLQQLAAGQELLLLAALVAEQPHRAEDARLKASSNLDKF